jgi:hypothetical protein
VGLLIAHRARIQATMPMISGHIAVHSCASCPLLELISRFEGESAQVSGGRQ